MNYIMRVISYISTIAIYISMNMHCAPEKSPQQFQTCDGQIEAMSNIEDTTNAQQTTVTKESSDPSCQPVKIEAKKPGCISCSIQ